MTGEVPLEGADMNKVQHDPAEDILTILNDAWGLTPGTLQRIGAIIVLWAYFERELDRVLWRLNGGNPYAMDASSDGTQPAQKLDRFCSLVSTCGSDEWRALVGLFYDAADNVLTIRNTLSHGRILPKGIGGGMLRYPRKLKKKVTDGHQLHTSEHTLGMVLEALKVLVDAAVEIAHASGAPHESAKLLKLRPKLKRARSLSGEVRHLHALMNHEKY